MLNFSINKFINKRYQPSKKLCNNIIQRCLLQSYNQIYIDIRIVDANDSQKYNLKYRGINKPTNVIALEYPETRNNFAILNGDIILCDSIIVTESITQNKEIKSHYIHMLVHALLHLQGLDHIKDNERKIMEKHEISILNLFSIANPYRMNL